ncbi:hypothetical protein [Mesorhizobium temperatum]|uniref:Uncharacterized protein n=1 Tax=Mesorhizobium temperatum TaxID=241416 RepID=A0A271LNC7_9HYPH|nr:hypothetical protein [Mesorhizobium temperatum]PAQ08896.1 hypothetical protein CIT26_14925 [Mesorhizobium temperatum]
MKDSIAFQLSDAFVNEGANVMYPIDAIEDALDVIMKERNSHHRRSNLASTGPGLGLEIVEAMFSARIPEF